MSGKNQIDLTGLINSIEGMTGLFENLLESELVANNSAIVQAENASTSAADAATSAASVSSLVASAAEAASTALAQATQAQAADSDAKTQATSAAASATSAATSAASAASAATVAQSAAASATNLSSEAMALMGSWSTVWLGKFTADPTTDNQGNALVNGAMYLNTADNPPTLRAYDAGAWADFDAATGSATQAAQQSAGQAASSAAAAASSASAAASSDTDAQTQASNAAASATSAANSATAAAVSASSMSGSVTAAAGSATAAANSATNAAASATSATSAASSAATSDSDAQTQATNAAASATAAANSATAANTQASAASASAASATSAATSATNSANAASASAGSAATSATSATNAQSAAAGSASTASTWATAANNSALAANTSATQASDSASAAAASVTAAASSANTAQTAATNATNLYNSWGQLWLGEFTSNPVKDNQGNALVSGAQYLNTTTTPPQVMVYLNGAWGALDADAQVATTSAQSAATQAAASQGAAATSATNASTSASAAASSASSAASSASTATTQATNAAGSATAASGSATAASGSATTATTEAAAATTSAALAQAWAAQSSGTVDGTNYSSAYYANEASTSASNSATSATNASSAASAASSSASAASSSAGAAATSQTSAANSASAAATSASAASGSATSATNSSAAASTSATNAGNSASAAASSAAGAATSATNAAGSASAAASSASAAASSALAAQAVQTNLNGIYTVNTTGGTITLSAAQYSNGIIIVEGVLASNVIINVPATTHPFILDNQSTGIYSVTVQMTGGSASVPVGQGNANQLFCDGSTGVYSVSSVSGLQFNGVKPISGATNALTNQSQGAYTPMSNTSGTTYTVALPQGATMGVGGAVFLDALSGLWSITPYAGDTADFGSAFSMGINDKAMFTWSGANWRTTLYTNQSSPVFSKQLTVPIGFITRGVFGGITDDGATAVQATTGRFSSSLTVPLMSAGDNSQNAANTAFVSLAVTNAINALIGGAPGALDTLSELANAINDDSSFASTMTNSLAGKAALSGASFTGGVSAPTITATTSLTSYGYGSNNATGIVYLGNTGTNYLLWDGTNYNLPNGALKVNGSAVWTAASFTPGNYAALASAPAFSGAVTGTGVSYALKATNGSGVTQTSIGLNQAGGTADAKNWEVIMDADQSFGIRAANDAYSAFAYALHVSRTSGYTLGAMQLMSSGGRVLVGNSATMTDDASTTLQVNTSLSVQHASAAAQLVSVSSATSNTVTSYSAPASAAALYFNATTDSNNTAVTGGALGLYFQLLGTTAMSVAPSGNVILGSAGSDDGVNKLQVYGGVGIKGTGKGITYPDGTIQTTAYAVTAPSVQTYTPANGVTTFAVQAYGLGLIMGFMNDAFMIPGTDYTASTGNSVTLMVAANGRTNYTFLTGSLFNASNVLQPQVAQVTGTVGNTALTLPFSAMAGYLWLFQGAAWLVPGQDFTFTGGTTVTLAAAPTQSTDSFTAISLQPVSFANCATQTNVQNAQLTFAMDTGVANAYSVAYIPAVGTPVNGMQVSFYVNVTNTGAATLVCNGGTAYSIYGNGHSLLTGNELVAGGFVEVVWNVVLGGWVLLENTGGAQQMSKNLNFSSTGQRIVGDMSNATYSNQLAFQSSTVNGNTSVNALPNGTGTQSQWTAFQLASPTNSPYFAFGVNASAAYVTAGALGTGTQLPLTFSVNGQERMRVLTNGNTVFANTTTTAMALPGVVNVNTAVNTTRVSVYGYGINQGYGMALQPNLDSGAVPLFIMNAAGTNIGGITSTSSGVAFNTTSDYRLKENVVPLKGALARLMKAKPVRYNFKTEPGLVVDGFIAHDLAGVVENAVVGKKDATWTDVRYREGYDPNDVQPDDVVEITHRIVPQQVDHSKMVPLLTAALQEAVLEIRALRTEVEALKKHK